MTFYDLHMNNKKITNCADPTAITDVATKNYIDTILSGYMKQVKVERFTASGTWTVPIGVTYAVAHILAGGGGVGPIGGSQTAGGNSSVAFLSGTVTATGGVVGVSLQTVGAVPHCTAGAPNSGYGAVGFSFRGVDVTDSRCTIAGTGALITAGADVAAGQSIAVVVGAGGTAGAGGAAGGSGYVWIEYY